MFIYKGFFDHLYQNDISFIYAKMDSIFLNFCKSNIQTTVTVANFVYFALIYGKRLFGYLMSFLMLHLSMDYTEND